MRLFNLTKMTKKDTLTQVNETAIKHYLLRMYGAEKFDR
jgi:hypothetical protein